MLRSLDIRDMLLIDRLELTFGPGLNVLTGETGAGKSILLDCLGFVLGWRGRAELVRAGAKAPTEEVVAGGLEAAKPFIKQLIEAQVELAGVAAKPVQEFPIFLDYEEDAFAAGVEFARAEGIIPAPESTHAVAGNSCPWARSWAPTATTPSGAGPHQRARSAVISSTSGPMPAPRNDVAARSSVSCFIAG